MITKNLPLQGVKELPGWVQSPCHWYNNLPEYLELNAGAMAYGLRRGPSGTQVTRDINDRVIIVLKNMMALRTGWKRTVFYSSNGNWEHGIVFVSIFKIFHVERK
jgi:hypothetical protein